MELICADHNYGPLVRYLRGCQQLIQLKMNVEKLHESSPDSSTPAQFSEVCKCPQISIMLY